MSDIRFVSGSKEFKLHPESLEARYRDSRQWTLTDAIAEVREAERQLAMNPPFADDSWGPRATEIGSTSITWEWLKREI